MDCRLCLDDSDAFRKNKLSAEKAGQIMIHLDACKECEESYSLDAFIDSVIDQQKKASPDPLLIKRIMTRIEDTNILNEEKTSIVIQMIRAAVIAGSLAAAIFAGVLIGNIHPVIGEQLPLEISLMDDQLIESIDLFIID